MHDSIERVLETIKLRDPDQMEFQQAVTAFLGSIDKVIENFPQVVSNKTLSFMVEPERAIEFRVPWIDDDGCVQINRGYRIQMNSALGPYKGGLRFHPSINLSIMKFLGFEQTFKNSLTGLSMGGAKGGSDFNPKGKSDNEVMRFCQSFMSELYRHIGSNTDVPAGDIGVGGREIGYMFGQYKRLKNEFSGILTGKGIGWGGSLIRTEATGYGLVYITLNVLEAEGISIKEKKCLISGSGNVAQYTCEKLISLGAKVLTLSDSSGMVYIKEGVTKKMLSFVKVLKNVRRGRIREMAEAFPEEVEYHPSTFVVGEANPLWLVDADLAFPCATQNEINEKDAINLVNNKIILVAEGANMPTTIKAQQSLKENGVLLIPAKAANAGGVAVSGLEMAQNSSRIRWSAEKVDKELQKIMKNIYSSISDVAERYSEKNNFVDGANIAAFIRVSEAMISQGYV